jgi:hypothetical protein
VPHFLCLAFVSQQKSGEMAARFGGLNFAMDIGSTDFENSCRGGIF